MKKYQWQGEPVKVQFGYCKVSENKERHLWWYNFECNISGCDFALIGAIKITAKDGKPFVIANHFGVGDYKLSQGGWPNCTHFSLPLDSFVPCKLACYKITEFDSIEYALHEANRNKWFKDNYPVEHEKMEALRKMCKIR